MLMILFVFANLLTFGVAIFIHELGHFIAAKLTRVRVEIFSFGFGKRLIGLKYGETDYRISAIPFGGYVKLAGESPEEERSYQEHEFLSKPWWKRVGVYLAGPFFNISLAIPVFIILLIIGVARPILPNIVGEVKKGSLGEEMGIKVKDEIIQVSGTRIQEWSDLIKSINEHPSNRLKMVVRRDGKKMSLNLVKPYLIRFEDLGLDYFIPAQIGSLKPGYPAMKAGLRVGDIITAIDGLAITQWSDLTKIVYKSKDKDLKVKLRRKDKELEVVLRPVKGRILRPDGKIEEVGLIGISPPLMKTRIQRFPILEAIPLGLSQAFKSMELTVYSIGLLLSGRASIRDIAGPVGIARMAGEHAQQGLSSLLFFIAFLSINLGIINLLPIPVVDGGQILFCLIEGIRGRMLSIRAQEIASKIGFALIVSFFIFITLNDVSKTGIYQGIKEKAFGWIRMHSWVGE